MVLMYHHVCPQASIPEPGRRVELEGWQYRISPEAFEFQLRCLSGRGWKFVSMDDYLSGLAGSRSERERRAVITFDDGWVDNHRWALPILTRMGLTATFFIVSGRMQGVSRERRMDSRQLSELLAAGMTIGAHTCTHPNLTALSSGDAAGELAGSRCELEDRLGVPVDLLAYPGGRFNERVVGLVKQAGYRAACCSIAGGRNGEHSRFWLYREVFSDGCDTLRDRILLSRAGRLIQGVRSRRAVRHRLSS